jgi:hypothetical protein
MAATCSATAVSSGKTTVTGSGYVGTEVAVISAFVSTDGKRRYLESYRVPVAAGAVSYDVPVPIAGGTVTVKTADTTAVVLATASNLSV